MARPGQASLPLPMGRELHRHHATRGTSHGRAPTGQQRSLDLTPGHPPLHHWLLPRQDSRRTALHGSSPAHHNPHDEPRLRLQARVHQVTHRVRQHDEGQAPKLQPHQNCGRRADHGPDALRHPRSLEESRKHPDPCTATLRQSDCESIARKLYPT